MTELPLAVALQHSFMYLGVQNASQPTPSVAVAFRSRQELKLAFSINPKENWLQWPNEQLRPHVSCVCLVCIDWMHHASSCQDADINRKQSWTACQL